MPEGEGDSGMLWLVPLWPGNSWGEPLGVLTRPDLPYYERWYSGNGIFGERDAKPHQPPPNPIMGSSALAVSETESSCSVRIEGGKMTPEQFSTFAFCCLATVLATEEHPLELMISDVDLNDEYLERLRKDPEWKNGKSCKFVLDPKSMKVLKGSVPGYEMKWEEGRIQVRMVAAIDGQ
jgi:hypothetical protein